MDIHEYQAKQLLSKFGVSIPPGEVVYQTHEAENIVTWLNEEKIVVKAQIHAGGRGKAGGVKICKNDDEVIKTVDEMIGMKLITPQTSVDAIAAADFGYRGVRHGHVQSTGPESLPPIARIYQKTMFLIDLACIRVDT